MCFENKIISKMKRMIVKQFSFTLIELLIVVAIIGILVSILMPSLANARKKANIAVCMSNLKQIATAGHTFAMDHDGKYPGAMPGNLNPGYAYYGKGGRAGHEVGHYQNVTSRPLNKYLGYTSDEDETPVVICPIDTVTTFDWIGYNGTSYMAAARTEHSKDLDNSWISTINNTSAMVFATNPGAWHFSRFGNNKWATSNHYPFTYSFSFTDGHVKNQKISRGYGINHSRDIIDFTNEP